MAVMPAAIDGGAARSKLPLWPVQGRASGALVEVLGHWRLCVAVCDFATSAALCVMDGGHRSKCLGVPLRVKFSFGPFASISATRVPQARKFCVVPGHFPPLIPPFRNHHHSQHTQESEFIRSMPKSAASGPELRPGHPRHVPGPIIGAVWTAPHRHRSQRASQPSHTMASECYTHSAKALPSEIGKVLCASPSGG